MSSSETFTLIDGSTAHEMPARIAEGRVGIASDEIARRLGWQLRAEGLCRGDVCVPIDDPDALLNDGDVDLAALAEPLRHLEHSVPVFPMHPAVQAHKCFDAITTGRRRNR